MECKESKEKSALNEVLECKFCRKLLNDPHTLQTCLHTFCKACIERIPKQNKDDHSGLICPTCDNFSEKDELYKNTFIQDLLAICYETDDNKDNTKIRCKQCPKNKNLAHWKCNTCKFELCDDCKLVHLQIPFLKGHSMTSLKEELRNVIDKVLYCSFHENEPLKLNCQNCEKLSCSLCNITEHKGHNVETIHQGLNRIIPEVEYSLLKVASVINVKEAQIAAINTKIDQTKGRYWSFRQQMDKRLDILINNLKAIKAQMDEDVTEQETITLDLLEDIRNKVEKHLNEAKNLYNLAKVTMEKTKHTSLLGEMQNRLYRKLNNCGEREQAKEEFKIKMPEFEDDQNLKATLRDLKEHLGTVVYTEQVCFMDTSGIQIKESDILCDDLTELLQNTFKLDQEIVASEGWCNRLSYINEQLWLPCAESGEIMVYAQSGEHLRTIDNDKGIIVVKEALNGGIFAGGDAGLYVTNDACTDWCKLTDAKIADICAQGVKMMALDLINSGVKIFKYETTKWKCTSVVQLNIQSIHDNTKVKSTLTVQNANILVTSSNGKHILISNDNGNIVNSFNFGVTFFCGKDKTGKILVANYSTGKLYVTDNLKNLTTMQDLGTLKIKMSKCSRIRDAVVDSENNIWTLSGNGPFKLIKYCKE